MNYHPSFFTATCLEWKKLLKPNKYKDIIVESLKFLVQDNRIKLYAFVIMDNHIHLIWCILGSNKKETVQLSFLRFTAQKIKQDLEINHPQVLEKFRVNASDRKYQFWERNPLSVELSNEEILVQKLDYIHENPVKANLCQYQEDYAYSSYRFYVNCENDFTFLSHYKD